MYEITLYGRELPLYARSLTHAIRLVNKVLRKPCTLVATCPGSGREIISGHEVIGIVVRI